MALFCYDEVEAKLSNDKSSAAGIGPLQPHPSSS
jgi:hypothetical protein